jgi:NIMA (never in mitosis gene a)-related kinase 1/4/5
MDYCEKGKKNLTEPLGDLHGKVKEAREKNYKFNSSMVLDWFCQLAIGLDHIHSKKVLHRDLKTSNILLTSANTVKIGDFGISKPLDFTEQLADTPLGTPFYLSPEVVLGQKYDYKSDIWMLGCVLYELITLRKPFEGNFFEIVRKIVNEPFKTIDADGIDQAYLGVF